MTRSIRLYRAATCALAIIAPATIAWGATWENLLEDGSRVSVDPTTNRAVIESGNGASRPLWDGVHRLEDGSVITVRSGLMVPNEEVMALRRGEEPAKTELPARERSAACDALVLKTCGLKNECGGIEACDLARQLRGMQWTGVATSDPNWADQLCQQGLEDVAAFAPCAAADRLMEAPCEALVEHVCGSKQRCANSQACKLAVQLLDLEQEARGQHAEEHALQTRRRCQTVLGEHAFFPPCR